MTVARRGLLTIGLMVLATPIGPALAQAFPAKPIRFIVPFAAGGNADVTARLVGEAMSRHLGQPIVIDNRPGAGGVVGQEVVLNAPADGYTIVTSAFSTLYVSPMMAGRPSMVPDFAPVSTLSTVPMVVVVPSSSRFATWQALLAEAKAKPGSVTVGHAGNGTPNHIDILRIQVDEKVTFSIVPYRGSGVGLNDVLAGQIDSFVDQLSSSLPHIKSDKLRPLAVVSEERVPELPDVPTLREAGSKTFDGGTTLGLFVRADTPKTIVAVLNAAAVAALSESGVRQRLAELGAVARSSTPEELAVVMRSDEASTSDLAKLGLLKPE